MDTTLIWGLVALAGGVFIAVYGTVLFRMVLGSAGLIIGFYIGMYLTRGQPEFLRLLVALLLGGGIGYAFYAFYRLGFYIAGAILGVVLAYVALPFLNTQNPTLDLAIVVFSALIGGFIGRSLGELIIIGSTSILGGYAIIYGLAILFPNSLTNVDTGRITMTPFVFAVFVMFVVVSALAQFQMRRMRRGHIVG
jgi:hypothetical protein